MTRRYFYPTWSQSYDGNNIPRTFSGGDLYQGQSPYTPNGNIRSLIGFDTADIRTQLAGETVTNIYFDFKSVDWYYSNGGIAVVGTHTYTSKPNTWNDAYVDWDRLELSCVTGVQVYGFQLGTRIGAEFKNGTSTGIALGPGPNRDFIYDGRIGNIGVGDLRLCIDSTPSTQAPYAPTQIAPASGAVANAYNSPTTFSWRPNDPSGSYQQAFYFKRRRGTTDQWWKADNSGWASTPQRIPCSPTNSTMALTIPAGQWTNGYHDYWQVATENTHGYVGSYSSFLEICTSTPPTVQITTPDTSGTVNTTRPTIRWTYTDPENDPQFGWVVQIVPESVYTQAGWSPNNNFGFTWQTSDSTQVTSTICSVDLTNRTKYRVYVQAASSPYPQSGLQFGPWAYREFTVVLAPSPPILDYPQPGSTADLNSGFSMQWHNTTVNVTGYTFNQGGFAIRRTMDGGAYQWWNGATWVATETFLAGAVTSYAFRTAEVTNGHVYNFFVAVRDAYGQTSAYSAPCVVTATTAATVTVLSPLATVTESAPIISWSMFDIENDPQQTYQVRVVAQPVYSALTTFDPATIAAVWDSGEVADSNARSVRSPVNFTNASVYRAYVRVKTNGVYSGWSYVEFTVSLIGPAAPTGYTTVHQDLGAIDITIQCRDSMLSDDASRCDGDWTALNGSGTVTNATIYGGSQSGYISNITCAITGNTMSAVSPSYPAVEGDVYTAAASCISAIGGAAANATVYIEFMAADNVTVIASIPSDTQLDAGAVRLYSTAPSPAGTHNVRIRVGFDANAVGEVHGLFDPVLRPGSGSEWTPGGLLGRTSLSIIEIGDYRLLRRGLNIPIPITTQRVTLRDEEVPIGTPQTYEAIVRTEYSNTVLLSPYTDLQPVYWTSGWLWLSDPMKLGSAISFGPQSFGTTTRPERSGKYRLINRADPVFVTGKRGLREGSYKIVTWTREELAAYFGLVTAEDGSGVILLRVPPDQGDVSGDTIYVKLTGDLPEERALASRTPHRVIEQTWSEQLRPLTAFEYGQEWT